MTANEMMTKFHARASTGESEDGLGERHQRGERETATREPSGWAAVVTGRRTNEDATGEEDAGASAPQTMAMTMTTTTTTMNVILDATIITRNGEGAVNDLSLLREDSGPLASSETDVSSPSAAARETRIIDGARENASAVGAGAKALRGWASILGGSSSPATGASPTSNDASPASVSSPSGAGDSPPLARASTRATAKTIAEDTRRLSIDGEPNRMPSPPTAAQPAWNGWAVKAPPPKVDLKTQMEADAAAAAAAPETRVASRAQNGKSDDHQSNGKTSGSKQKQQQRNGKQGANSKQQRDKNDKQVKRQDSFRKDKPSRVAIHVAPAAAIKPIDVSMSSDNDTILSKDLECAIAAKLGRELLESAHVQNFTPTAQLLKKERRSVEVVIRAMTAIVQTLFPQTGLDVFGSYPTKAWVPGSSNLDLALNLPESVASHPDRRMEALNTLAMALRSNPWVIDVAVVPSAYRPLIRMQTHTAFFQPMTSTLSAKAAASLASAVASVVPPSMTSEGVPPLPPGPRPPYGVPGLGQGGIGLPLEVHISLKDANHTGVAAARFVSSAEQQNGALAPLVSIQKAVLASKGLRGVYKGGLGSYALTLMALTSIQRSAFVANADADAADADADSSVVEVSSAKDDGKKKNAGVVEFDSETDAKDAMTLGRAMLDFLKLYGHDTDLSKDIVSVCNGGDDEWGILRQSTKMQAPLGSGLRVQDPMNDSNNAGAGCFGIAGVQAAFREQLDVLKRAAETNFEGDVSLLMRLTTMTGSQHKVFVV
jgi:DNA polymerase sigma